MEPISIWNFLTAAMPSVFGVPIVLLLVDRWRYPARVIRWMVTGLGLFLVGFNAILLFTLGSTMYAGLLTSLLCPVVCWVGYFICFDYRDGRLMFTLVTGVLAITVIETLANCFTSPEVPAGFWLRVGLYLGMDAANLFLLRKPFLRMLSIAGASWVRMTVLPFSFFVCLLTAYAAVPGRATPYPEPLPPLMLCVAVLVIYTAIYFALTSVQKQQQAERGYDLLDSQMRHLERQTEQIKASDRDNRTFRHDMRHFITLMQGAAAQGDWDTLQKVLATMGAKVDELSAAYPVCRYTGELTIDSVLSLAETRAQKEGIDFTVSLSLPGDLAVDITELAVVVSNVLENALDACAALPEGRARWLRLNGSRQRQQFFLSISNSCEGEVYFDPVTSLPISNQAGHGFGIQSIAAFAAKYNALLDFRTEDGVFTMSILF